MTLRNSPEFGRMAEVISEKSRGKGVLFISNPGNLGDSLIRAGAEEFISHYGFRSESISSHKVKEFKRVIARRKYFSDLFLPKKKDTEYFRLNDLSKKYSCVVYCGGGYWLDGTKNMRLPFVLAENFEDVIVMPSTFGVKIDSLPSNVTLFRRDNYQSKDNCANSIFCHDTAFFLKPEEGSPIRKAGWHLREDPESTNDHPIPRNNYDISYVGTEMTDPEVMFDEVRKSASIVTDRLHVSIAGALLGRKVYLLASNYFKIPAIYKSSIEQNYGHVEYLRSLDELPVSVLSAAQR